MYPVKLGYEEAISRINGLVKNDFVTEAFVTTVFTLEKTFYRVFRQLVISAGFKSTQATVLLKIFKGIEAMKTYWECFDLNHEKLSNILGQNNIRIINEAQKMRNDLVHGKRVYKDDICLEKTNELLAVLDNVRIVFQNKYNFDGWSKIKGRKVSTLHIKRPLK